MLVLKNFSTLRSGRPSDIRKEKVISKTYPGHNSAPLTPSQLVFHDNVVAAEQMPDDMVQRLTQRRLYLSSADAKADLSPHLKRHADLAGIWEVDLPREKPSVSQAARRNGWISNRHLRVSSAKRTLMRFAHLCAERLLLTMRHLALRIQTRE